MSEPFLITGLPRSRTAWMAAAALNDSAVCIHEPTRHFKRWEEVFDTIWAGCGNGSADARETVSSRYRYMGVSDHGLGFHLQAIMGRLAPRTLIIERPGAEVDASLARLGLPATNFCDILQRRLAYEHPAIMRVGYAALASDHVVLACLRHLMPASHHCPQRISQLQRLNIQAHDIKSVIADARSRDAGAAVALLGADVVAQLRAA